MVIRDAETPTARLNSFFPWLEDVLEDDAINHLCEAAEHHIAQCCEWETDLKETLQELLDYFRPEKSDPHRTPIAPGDYPVLDHLL